MKIIDTLHAIAEELNLSGRTLSKYGEVNNVNVRVSDHEPLMKNLVDYERILKANSSGVYDMYFVILNDELYSKTLRDDFFEDEMSDDLKDNLEYMLDKTFNVKVAIYQENENHDVVLSCCRRDLKSF